MLYRQIVVLFLLIFLQAACVRPLREEAGFQAAQSPVSIELAREEATSAPFIVETIAQPEIAPGENETTATPKHTKTPLPVYAGIPTPDPPHVLQGDDAGSTIIHVVTAGEGLGPIAARYGVSQQLLLDLNQIDNANLLYVGQQLLIPQEFHFSGSEFKIIPDSEVVYGPAVRGFDVQAVVSSYGGSLLSYSEEVEGVTLSGSEIVQLVADRFQVNPRLLLALVEYRAGILTQQIPVQTPYPLGYDLQGFTGLYWQLGRVANLLNAGMYGWRNGTFTHVVLDDELRVGLSPIVNAGTIAVQNAMSNYRGATIANWQHDVGEGGFFATYKQLFGNPFAYTVAEIMPANLRQPPLRLPWPDGETWYFTGGPHGGYGWGTPWAALDFVPAGEELGCYDSDAWVVAMADGLVVRSSFGGVVIDLDGDGFTGNGWTIHYLHLAERERVNAGSFVKAGDPIGHPSCEGGFANGTHIHIARTFNGYWLDASAEVPFQIGGWRSQGLEFEYDGLLQQGEEIREACECREELNGLTAE